MYVPTAQHIRKLLFISILLYRPPTSLPQRSYTQTKLAHKSIFDLIELPTAVQTFNFNRIDDPSTETCIATKGGRKTKNFMWSHEHENVQLTHINFEVQRKVVWLVMCNHATVCPTNCRKSAFREWSGVATKQKARKEENSGERSAPQRKAGKEERTPKSKIFLNALFKPRRLTNSFSSSKFVRFPRQTWRQ